MDDFEKELKIGFLEEAEQAVSDVEQCFLALEASSEDPENLNKIFRLAHNLKGSSKAVGFDDFGAFTHQFESFILKVKNNELKATSKVVSLLLRANDHIAEMIKTLKGDLDATFDSVSLLNEMSQFSESESASESEAETETEAETVVEEISAEPEVTLISLPEPSDVNEAAFDAIVKAMSEGGPTEHFEKSFEAQNSKTPLQNKAPISVPESSNNIVKLPQKAASQKTQTVAEESLRVSLSKVELLINFVGEMVILQSVMQEQAANINSPLLKKTVTQLGKVGKEIQDLAMGLRMVPVKPTFQKMTRIVRDTAQQLGKDVAIHLVGEETELDKTVLEKINDPLVHLIRNSVDHGIESAEKRIAKGKTSKGNVTLSAYHQSGKLILEVQDDGGGLDPNYLKRKAIEKGLIKENNVLTDKECLNLIFAPGFSTKEQVTDVSGRGVGMDVVRTNIQELSGEIQLESELGTGTLFRISLPLTLAIVEAMVVTYSDNKFVIPLSHVFETLKVDPGMLQTNQGLGDILMLRGENLPLVRLGDFLGLKSQNSMENMIAMVIKSGKSNFAILVDDILGQYQVVIKQLGPELEGLKGVSGSTILGDGKPALIIEPQDLLKRKITNGFTASKGKVVNRTTSTSEAKLEGVAS